LHPNDNESESFDSAAYEELARDPKVVAIGECGLDYFRSSGEGQKERFEAHVEFALKVKKPLIIHCRGKEGSDFKISGAHFDVQQMLHSYKERLIRENISIIIHFFTGSAELAQSYLDLGCYLSFPGPITFTDMYDESIRLCPLECMLVETDAPFAAPAPHRGKRNEPKYVIEVARKISALKSLSYDVIAQQTAKNAQQIFSLA